MREKLFFGLGFFFFLFLVLILYITTLPTIYNYNFILGRHTLGANCYVLFYYTIFITYLTEVYGFTIIVLLNQFRTLQYYERLMVSLLRRALASNNCSYPEKY